MQARINPSGRLGDTFRAAGRAFEHNKEHAMNSYQRRKITRLVRRRFPKGAEVRLKSNGATGKVSQMRSYQNYRGVIYVTAEGKRHWAYPGDLERV